MMYGMKTLTASIIALVLLASCSTIGVGRAQAEAQLLLDRVGNGETEAAIAMSARPFLFESEILISEAMVGQLWEGLAGTDFSTAEISRFVALHEGASQGFKESWELDQWLARYSDENTIMVFFNWQNRELVVVVNRDRRADARISGFGEVQ